MTAGERDLIDKARDVIAARITAACPGWQAGHDLQGWHARRLEDGHLVRAAGPAGLRALIGVAPSPVTWQIAAELRAACPDWHIWRDGTGWWHARRRGTFRELRRPGAPLYAVHAPDLGTLRARLQEQQARASGEGAQDEEAG